MGYLCIRVGQFVAMAEEEGFELSLAASLKGGTRWYAAVSDTRSLQNRRFAISRVKRA